MPYVLFLLISLIWSTSFILMKKATLGFTPLSIGAWRCIWGALVLGMICWRRKELMPSLRSNWLAMALVTLVGCAWPYAIQPFVVTRQGSAFMALAVSFVPLATIFASVALLRVWPTTRQILGVCGALGCLVLLLLDGLDRNIPPVDFALAMSVPVGYAIANTVIRGWLSEMHATTLTFYLLTATSLLLLPFTLVETSPPTANSTWCLGAVSLVTLEALGTGLGTYWFNQLIRDHGPLFAGMVTNVVPIGAVLWGWADNELVTIRQSIALAGIVAMVVLVQFGAARNAVRVDPQIPQE